MAAVPYAPSGHYVNPLVGTLAELAMRNSAQRADGIRRSGEIVGSAWQNIGNTVAGSLANLAKARMEAPERAQEQQARNLEIQAKQGEIAAQQRQLADAGEVDTALGAAGDDETQLQAALAQVHPRLRPGITEAFNKSQAAKAAATKARTELDAAVNDWVGADAYALSHVGADKNPEAVHSLLTDAKARGLRDADGLLSQLQQDPTSAPAIVSQLVGRSGKQREMAGQEADRTLRQTTEQRMAAQAAQAAADKEADNKRADAIAVETGRHNKAMENRPVAGAAVAYPGDFTLTGDDFIKTIPLQSRRTVEKIAKYDEDPTKVVSMRGADREKVMAWVNQVNPAYDSSMFSNRAPTRKAYTTGAQGKQITSLNTVIGHLDQIVGVAEKLNNSDFVPGNKAANELLTMFGSDKATNFDGLKDAVAGEVAGVLANNGATVDAVKEARGRISAASSPQQLAGFVKTLIPVMGSKLSALDYNYHQAMGADDPFSALSPESKRILTKHGFDPSHPTLAGEPSGSGGGISVTAPNGKTYPFADQAAADKFVADAKAKGLWK
jgi:hypothetical protein